jgi:hypothetical protein
MLRGCAASHNWDTAQGPPQPLAPLFFFFFFFFFSGMQHCKMYSLLSLTLICVLLALL